MSIVILDYGIGNVKSISNAFKEEGVKAILSRDRDVILKAEGIVLPGVGAFYQGMNNLNKYGLVDIIKEYVKTEKPLLGICLGMQMLLEESEEFGVTKGLGLVKGKVVKIPIEKSNKIKLPHISWNEIQPKNIQWKNTIFNDVKINSDMYFVHSYVANLDNNDEILSTTDYFGAEFCSALKKENIYGCQFHPEKSAEDGLQIIKNFISICK